MYTYSSLKSNEKILLDCFSNRTSYTCLYSTFILLNIVERPKSFVLVHSVYHWANSFMNIKLYICQKKELKPSRQSMLFHSGPYKHTIKLGKHIVIFCIHKAIYFLRCPQTTFSLPEAHVRKTNIYTRLRLVWLQVRWHNVRKVCISRYQFICGNLCAKWMVKTNSENLFPVH